MANGLALTLRPRREIRRKLDWRRSTMKVGANKEISTFLNQCLNDQHVQIVGQVMEKLFSSPRQAQLPVGRSRDLFFRLFFFFAFLRKILFCFSAVPFAVLCFCRMPCFCRLTTSRPLPHGGVTFGAASNARNTRTKIQICWRSFFTQRSQGAFHGKPKDLGTTKALKKKSDLRRFKRRLLHHVGKLL